MKLINSTLGAIFYKILIFLINVWLKLNQLFVSKKFGINLIEKKSDYSIFEYYLYFHPIIETLVLKSTYQPCLPYKQEFHSSTQMNLAPHRIINKVIQKDYY